MGAVRNAGLASIRLAGALLLLIALSAGLIAPDRASAATTFTAGDPVVTTDQVNVRTTPDTSGAVRAVAVAGQPFTIGQIKAKKADGYTWYRVSTATRVNYGWIASDFLALNLPFDGGGCAVVVDGSLNLRESAGTASRVLDVLADGTGVSVDDRDPVRANGFLWYRIVSLEIGGTRTSGWVASQFLEARECDDLDTDVITVDATVRVFDGPLNARAEPDLSADISRVLADEEVGVITDGPVTADGYVWWEFANTGGVDEWVVSDFIVADPDALPGETPSTALDVGDDFTVNTDALNVRSTAGLDGDIIDMAAFGAVGSRVTGGLQTVDGLGWIKVTIPNVGTGWVVVDFVTES